MAKRRLLLAATIVALGTTGAQAQTVSVMRCRASFGAALGVTNTGDRAAEKTGHSRDVGAAIEIPVSDRWGARADFGTATWAFQERDPWDVLLGEERVRLERVTISAVTRGPRPCGAPIRPFAGFGAGGYRYRFQEQGVQTVTAGLHGVFGLEILPAESFAIGAELSLDAIGGPHRGPVFSEVLWIIRATIGVKLLF